MDENADSPDPECSVPAHLVDVGKDAVWSVSSCKAGYGVEKLRDGDVNTYWQSDGPQPHTVSIQFPRRVALCSIHFFTNHMMDETYTPKRVAVKIGTGFHDLYEVETVDLEAPNGWQNISLLNEENEAEDVFMVQLQILSNHENGRDTHLRQIKVFEPKQSALDALKYEPKFSTVEFSQYSDTR